MAKIIQCLIAHVLMNIKSILSGYQAVSVQHSGEIGIGAAFFFFFTSLLLRNNQNPNFVSKLNPSFVITKRTLQWEETF